jgi:putative membrane protein
MKRAKFDRKASESLGQIIRDIEAKTDAELVVVVRGRSGTYRHADYLWGAIVALTGLVFVLFSPFDFHTYWVPFDVVLLFVLGAFVSSRSDPVRRLLTSGKLRAKAVRNDASAMFYEAGIANTHAENGMLIYLSLLERRLEIIADRGILKAVPPLKWNHLVYEFKQVAHNPEPDSLIRVMHELGSVLAEHLPPTGENPNELADGPRIELK